MFELNLCNLYLHYTQRGNFTSWLKVLLASFLLGFRELNTLLRQCPLLFQGTPEIDKAPTTSSVTSNSVIIQFIPADPPAASYRIQYRTRTTNYQDGPKIPHSDNSPEYSIRLDNLIANTEYEIRIVPLYGPRETQGYSSPSVFIRTSQQSKYK